MEKSSFEQFVANRRPGDVFHAPCGSRAIAQDAVDRGVLLNGDSCSFPDDDGSFVVADIKDGKIVVAIRSR